VNFSAIFIRRPVATTLLTLAIVLAGILGYFELPVAPLPQVDFPVILVQATLPGASPETVASSVAAPLEKHLGTIADLDEMTSQSFTSTSRVVLQFGLDRDIDGAARDVEAGLNAAHADLPTQLRLNPIYHKINPADAPILVIALTSKSRKPGQIFDAAANIVQQRLSELTGIGEVDVAGAALPSVRVELDPDPLAAYGIGLEDIRAAIASANADSPKGAIEIGPKHYQVYTNDQAVRAADYRPLVIAYRNNAPVFLTSVGEVDDSVEDLRNAALANGMPAVLVIVYRQPGANIIEAVDSVRGALPELQAALPADIDVTLIADRTPTIRASLHDTQAALVIALALVIGVVFLFLGEPRAALIPSIVVPVSIIGTFGIMYLLGYSLDNLSLMALTIATGFVVDDAIVVLENISRHIEAGMPRAQAALRGAREVGFTVLSISVSLVAVFLPILLMGGLIGRLFREFAVTLSLSIVVSLVVSLTTTPMLCAQFLRPQKGARRGLARVSDAAFNSAREGYRRSLGIVLRHPFLTLATLGLTVAFNFYLFSVVPKGFFPQQDTGRMIGTLVGDQTISFQSMREKMLQFMTIVRSDPAVENIAGFTGGRQTNSGFFFVALKPRGERHASADQVIARLRGKLARVAGAALYLQVVQDIRTGGRQSNAQYQFTLQDVDPKELYEWTGRLTAALAKNPALADVSSDQQQAGSETYLQIDRKTAARFGLFQSTVDQNLYDAFGQRQVSTIYNPLNQYHVVMEVAPRFWQDRTELPRFYISPVGSFPNGTALTNAVIGTVTTPHGRIANSPLFVAGSNYATTFSGEGAAAAIATNAARNSITNAIANTGGHAGSTGAAVSTARESMVPLAAIAQMAVGKTPVVVNHQGQLVATTISFNIPLGHSLGEAVAAIDGVMRELGAPTSLHGEFAGTAKIFQQSLRYEPVLIAAALLAVYIVLGILYESYVHPLTILSTLPSAGVGAILALMLTGQQFTIIALIGVILLIGIVKKNAIMMIDFALDAERNRGLDPRTAIAEACALRFRPIMMTTFAATLGALPLAVGGGDGAELRAPLGISIIGGLLVSQVLTLYTTPIVYLELDRLRLKVLRWRRRA
jgi:multidrug efflux pump